MKPAALWPAAIVGVLAVTVIANVALLITARDPHAAAIEPDYYRKAVRWDSTLAEARRGAALGWRLDAEILEPSPDGALLRVTLRDRGGRPLDGARVNVVAIHNLEADAPVTAEPIGVGDGIYEVRLALRHPGEWELRLAATRGGDRFVTSLRREALWSSTPR